MKREEALEILNNGFTHTIKDPLWQNIKFTKELKELLDIRDIEKLNRIRQNGPSYLIYPGAVHTRLNHSIGVYHLARELMTSLSKSRELLPFTKEGIMSFLSACLLHDIGHFPYAHSLKELSIREHEEIAETMILNNRAIYDQLKRAGARPEMVGAIINKDRECNDKETLLYRNILSGTLDPDKLDYLSRDGFFAGIPYGKQDTDYIISSLALTDEGVALKEEAISSIENILFSKYMMYKTLYWHKGVRSATAMIKKALLTALREGVINYDDLYELDDNEFNTLCKNREHLCPALLLVDSVSHGELLERKLSKPYDKNGAIEANIKTLEDRYIKEDQIFSILSPKYPELKKWEVVIDIPEPISFETHLKIVSRDGKVHDLNEEDMIFSSSVSETFSKSLRKLALYLPAYVSESDAEIAFFGGSR